ncbi:MAG TPA: nuclear transport factor 2 family protein [Actinomycetota bacterium]|nr:nuclear transport factor 2 family protein [Actinomycetota bacterium]
MTPNKEAVTRYVDGFRRGDRGAILACLAEDVTWEIPGHVSRRGKAEFDREIENEGFTGHPEIEIERLVEEGDVVVAEGSVRHTRVVGAPLHARFCDVFHMEQGLIKRLTSYLVQMPAGSAEVTAAAGG